MQDNRVVINPQDVLDFLADGKTREEIREHYGLNKSDLNKLFQHDLLKGKKTKKAPGFVFSDAVSQQISNTVTETIQDEAVNVQDSVELEASQTDYVAEQQESNEQSAQWKN